jgi:glycosyltransferase involved in cell wall biosynthesis
VLVVSQYFWPENLRVNDLVAELTHRGHQITVLTGKPNYPQGEVYPVFAADPEAYSRFEGARIVRVPMITRGKSRVRLVLNYLAFAVSASTVGAWRLRGEQFDVVFAFVLSPVTVCVPAVVQRALKGCPSVYWILDQWPESLEAVGAVRSRRVLSVVGWMVSVLYRRCDLILGQSRRMLPFIRRYADAAQRVEYFPNWAEEVFGDVSQEPAAEVPSANGVFTIMYAGNVGDAQDFPTILAAAERLRHRADVRWLIVGDGRATEWVMREISRLGLGDRVLVLGRYPVERMPSFFMHADALLVSLRKDPVFAATVPGKVQAYLAAGLPILAALDGEGADVVAESDSGIACPPGDPVALAAAVLRMLEVGPERRDAMGANGRRYYLREFDRTHAVSRLERLLSGVTRASSG